MQLHESIVVVPSNRSPRTGREWVFPEWTKMTYWKKSGRCTTKGNERTVL
jgi:hypothetical protein